MLTDEDKQWISTKLEAMGPQIETRLLEAIEPRIETRLLEAIESRNEARLLVLESRIEARLLVLESRIETRLLEAIESRIGTRLEALETKLLTAFHQWASPQEMRQRSHAAAIKALDAETEYLTDRVTKLERKADGGIA
jgi:hypothetical protein